MKKTINIFMCVVLLISALSGLLSGCMRNTDSIKDSEETIAEDSIKENVVSKNKENTETELKQTEDFAVETNKDDKSENNDIVSNEKLSIVTTIFPQYDFTKQIVGDKADVTMLLKPGLESHSYEPTPQDIKTIQSSDLFIYTGGENDTWIYGIIESMGDSAPETMKLIDLVNTVEEEIVEGMQHDHGNDRDYVEYADYEEEHDHAEHEESEEDYKDREKDDHKHVHEVDEHVWTSPINAIKIVEQITNVLNEKDPINAEIYSENSAAYIERLKDLDQQFEDVIEHAKRKVILFGDRFPFRYFTDEYDLDYYAAFTGCSANTEASAATVAFLIDKVNELQLPVVFSIELSNEKIADSIVEATDAEKMTFHSIHKFVSRRIGS